MGGACDMLGLARGRWMYEPALTSERLEVRSMPMEPSMPGLCKYAGYASVSGATETLDALKAPKYSLGWGGGMLSSGPGEL